MEININHQIQELREEQEGVSQHEPNITVPPPTPEEEDEYLGLGYDIHDYGFMETYIFMD